MKKYAPEALKTIEKKFEYHKKEGKLTEFENFRDFYDYLVKVSLKGTEIYDGLNLDINNDEHRTVEGGRKFAIGLKSDFLTKKFFTEQDTWKSGELIDKKFIEKVIKDVASNVAEESYS